MAPKKILVAYDFSDPSKRALELAVELAERLGAKLDVMHVHPDIYDGKSQPSLGIPWPDEEQEERYMRFLDTELQGAVAEHSSLPVEQVARHVMRGDPVRRIEHTAEETGAELIVVGSTGKGAVERTLLGSVSQMLIRTSKVPVLTVH